MHVKKIQETDLTFVTVDNHGHTGHVNTFLRDLLQAGLQLVIERVKMLDGHGSDVYGQLRMLGTAFLVEVNVRAEGTVRLQKLEKLKNSPHGVLDLYIFLVQRGNR